LHINEEDEWIKEKEEWMKDGEKYILGWNMPMRPR
jgi:hypothetical protein